MKTTAKNGKRTAHLSKDARWRSFPKVPNLLQYVSTGTYYGRIKVSGKIIRQSLKTDVWTNAKLRLVDFLKENQETKSVVEGVSFTEAVERYKATVQSDVSIKESSKAYLLNQCLRKIELSWPELWTKKITEISEDACREWAAKLSKEISSQYFNNTVSTLRVILETGIKEYVQRDGDELKNPAKSLSRARVPQRPPELPERDQFHRLVESIRKGSGGWGHRAADLVEFLAYSGMRLRTEALWVTWKDIDWKRNEIVVRGNPTTHTKNWEIRRIPILPDMEKLLRRIAAELGGAPSGKILEVARCYESLKRACKEIGISRISHHDLRHLFATRCIEAGVDIPTVARWLGHKDGGALAMKTYGHLRNEHSQAMAQKVRF